MNTETDQLSLNAQKYIIEHKIPILEPQSEIWLACMLGGESANKSYNISFYEYLEGDLYVEALRHTLQTLINRHQSLRATFSVDGTEMLIYDHRPLDFTFNDISKYLPDEKEAFLNNLLDDHADWVFDLVNGPLFKTTLTKLDEAKFHLSITFHHIICDGFSSGILMNELCFLYNQLLTGSNEELQPPVEFSKYALNKHSTFNSPEYRASEAFWLDQFKDDVPVLNIPPDFERPAVRSYSGARVIFEVNDILSKRFKKIGFEHGCSSAISLRAALEIFLYRICGQKKIVTGLPVAGQLTEEDPNLVGHCVNLLPLKTEMNDHQSYTNYLVKRRDYILEAYSHHQLTFSSLLNKLNISRDPSRVPLVPVLLNIQSDMYDNHFHELKNRSSFNVKKYETFEITINVDDLPSGMTFRWDYNTSLFSSETIHFFHRQFEYIFEQIVENPAILIEDIKLLECPHRKFAPTIEPIEKTLYSLLNESFSKHGEQIAVTFKDKQISYDDLDKKSNQFARLIQSFGVKEGDRVGISIERSIELIVAVIGIVKAGAAYLPLDRTFPSDRISQIIDNSDLACIIYDKTTSNIANHGVTQFEIDNLIARFDEIVDLPLKADFPIDNPVYVLHTSGSTGRPKGVCMNQLALTNLLTWQERNSFAKAGTKTLQFTPITFDVSFQEIFSTLTTGGILHVITDEQRIDGLLLLEQINKLEIERLFLPFVALQSLAENAVITNSFPIHLEEVITAGEQLKITPHIEKFFAELPTSTLFNQYGPTEAHVVSQLKLSGLSNLWPKLPPIGTPITNCEIMILDERLQPVYPGVPGELCISGIPLSPGYLNLDETTKQKFLLWNDKEGNEKRIYRTGDLARFLPDGNLEYLDRIDNQVKIRGYRIELMEIEFQVAKLDEISLAAAKVQYDAQGNARLLAYFVPQVDTFEVDEETFEKWKRILGKKLPDYMIPFDFIQMDQMPMTSTGKIDRNALPEVKEFRRISSKKAIFPRTATERFLAEVWSNALGINEVSIDDNFFELGGNSLLAVKVITAIQKEKDLKIPLSALFDHSSIEKLAKLITSNKEKIRWDCLVPIKTTGTKTPVYLIHGGGLNVLNFKPLEKLMHEDQPIYALQALGLNGKSAPLDSMEEIASRYIEEILNNDPTGPYALGGYSFGGLLAFEIARQLKGKGKDVSSLAILDTYAGGRDINETNIHRLTSKVARQLRKIVFFGKLFIRRPKEVIGYQKGVFHYKMKKIISRGYQVEKEFFTFDPDINERYEIAYNKYKMRPLDIKVDLFRAKKRLYYLDDGKFYGWKRYAKLGVQIHESPGDHKTFLSAPNIDAFASKLQKVLDNNDSTRSNVY